MKLRTAAAIASLMLATAGPSLAQKTTQKMPPKAPATANDISDLIGARERRSGEAEMEARGFYMHHRAKDGDGLWSYWWSPASRSCVQILSSNGRYEQVQPVAAVDCGQSRPSADDPDSIPAIEAAVNNGALTLSHDAHAHPDDQHLTDADDEADFDRGYRDGLLNISASGKRPKDYITGHSEGMAERLRRTTNPKTQPVIDLDSDLDDEEPLVASTATTRSGSTRVPPNTLTARTTPSTGAAPNAPASSQPRSGSASTSSKAGTKPTTSAKSATTEFDTIEPATPAMRAALADLAYQDLAWAQIEMQRRGYAYAATDLKADYFLNTKTGKCVALAAERGKVTDVSDVPLKNCR